jgi:hypothetical protein
METIYPKVRPIEHPGKYDVLGRLAIEHLDQVEFVTTIKNLAETSGEDGRVPGTVEATIYGEDGRNGVDCIILSTSDENEVIKPCTSVTISFDKGQCGYQCDYWGQCPLQEVIDPPVREKDNVHIEPRSIGIDVLGQTAEISESMHAEFYDLIMRGNLGRFEIAKSQYVDINSRYSRNLVLTHPDFVEQEFVATFGLVTLMSDGTLKVELPDTTRNVQDVYKEMGTTFIRDRKRINVLNNSVLGSYQLDRLQTKVDGMNKVNMIIGDLYDIPKTISYGKYSGDNELNNLGWLIYSRPKDVKMMSELAGDIYRKIPNVLERFAAFEGRDIQTLLEQIEIKFGKLMVDNTFAMKDFHTVGMIHNQWHPSNIGKKDNSVYIADFETLEFTTDPYARANEIGYMMTRFTSEIYSALFNSARFALDSSMVLDEPNLIKHINQLRYGNRLMNLQLFVRYVTDTMLGTFANVYWNDDNDKKSLVEEYMKDLFDSQYALACSDISKNLKNISDLDSWTGEFRAVLTSMEDIASRLAGKVAATMFLVSENLHPDSLDESYNLKVEQRKQKEQERERKRKEEKKKKQKRKAGRK